MNTSGKPIPVLMKFIDAKGSLERRYTDISGDTGQVENDEYHYGDIY